MNHERRRLERQALEHAERNASNFLILTIQNDWGQTKGLFRCEIPDNHEARELFGALLAQIEQTNHTELEDRPYAEPEFYD